MARTHRLSTTGALIVCLVGAQWSGTLFASEQNPPSVAASSSQSVVNGTPEAQGLNSPSPAPAVSASEQPASATEPQPPAVERSRFALNDEILTANAPLGPASEQVRSSALRFARVGSGSLAQRGWYGGRGRGGRNGAITAIMVGAVAAIAGGAILVYAYRPECDTTNHMASGCGYGTKVVGGAVLSAGVVGLLVGALTWR